MWTWEAARLLSDLNSHYAPWIVLASFSISAAIVSMIDRRWRFPRGFWLAVDGMWIIASVLAFLIVVSSIVAESPRREALALKNSLINKKLDIDENLPVFSFKYCGKFDGRINRNFSGNGSPKLHIVCDTVDQLVDMNSEITPILENSGLGYDIPVYLEYYVDSVEVEMLEEYGREWASIQYDIFQFDRDARSYNAIRPQVKFSWLADFARDAWVWIFPFVAGFRFNRSIVDFRRRTMAEI